MNQNIDIKNDATEFKNLIAKTNPGPFVLASLLSSYPDLEFSEGVRFFLQDEQVQIPQLLRELVQKAIANEDSLNDLRSEYIAIFDHAKNLNPLYETEYGRERAMFKANELADIAGFYHAFGFELDQENGTREMPDHISVELEFYSLLMMKHLFLQEEDDFNGCEIVFDGMKKFMESHLGRFVSAIIDRPGVVESEFYYNVFVWIKSIVEAECGRLQISPDKATWFASQTEGEKMCCGDSVPVQQR